MISLLAKWLIRDRDQLHAPGVRRAYGVLCGAVGIGLNLLLFLGKLLAGVFSGSIAIMADAMNNLSDAGSSVITLIGFQLAGQKPDPEHPFGHGRLEYLSGLIVSLAIILMGVELGKSSLEKIFHPEPVEFSLLAVGILAASIGVKIYMACYNRAVGKKIGSAAMKATAADSLSDCISTAVVLAAMLIGHWTGLLVDGWCGVLVALFILRTGIGAAKETVDPLLGQPPTAEFVQSVHDLVMSYDGIIGIHDLVVHDYGPGRRMLSLHAEVPASGSIVEIHDVIDRMERRLGEEMDCEAVIHMDPVDVDDARTVAMKQVVADLVGGIEDGMTIHDFRMVSGPTHTNLIFDAVLPAECKRAEKEIEEEIVRRVEALPGNYYAVVHIDRAYISLQGDA
ncbi:cation diffusion facilitator family transporter [Cuneatibacter sp. NSJ-177]|uniref:cation diffusion facilitator family transporter n=1 Tax=Cuneatibacter sp. NSJ-177 TaxID=2931401 RepID=UPI001FD2CBCB|nr:cation diffusion facilitator family transporter [Cuneatibacter sp. NSJ-177]MCJ7836837.1 cation diffusion facilitator family transporter [Cuneatibacter sp. NSJ-177]